MTDPFPDRALVREALELLGGLRLALACFDASFPSEPDEELGYGSPYGRGASRFLDMVRSLGFGALQLGPQGETSEVNPSPYDGALFTRSALSIALAPLAEGSPPLLAPASLARLVAGSHGAPNRAEPSRARRAIAAALVEARQAFERDAARRSELDELLRRLPWLERQGLYEALRIEHGPAFLDEALGHAGAEGAEQGDFDRRLFAPRPGERPRAEARRAELLRVHEPVLRAAAFAQHVVRAQHAELRARLREGGLELYGDLQIGVSDRDLWANRALFLPTLRLGAPPSRTTPAGQDWGYPVLDPALYGEPCTAREGPALGFVRARLEDALGAYDGVRIDHPHGLIDPWVYLPAAPDAEDPLAAVRAGARLFAAPDLADHPELARYAIARPAQLDRGRPRWDERWVRALEDGQVERYAAVLAVVVDALRAHGREPRDLAVEVLSTLPYPLARVLDRFGLGRFRVTQKASVDDPSDPYRSEHAEPSDWIMMGNHDTEPIWHLVERWGEDGSREGRARRVSERVAPAGAGEATRAALAQALAADPRALALAHAAELFTSRARNVLIFVGDLLGWREPFNVPGTTSARNWSRRVEPGFEAAYLAARARGDALDLRRALAIALRARGGDDAIALAAKLDALAARE